MQCVKLFDKQPLTFLLLSISFQFCRKGGGGVAQRERKANLISTSNSLSLVIRSIAYYPMFIYFKRFIMMFIYFKWFILYQFISLSVVICRLPPSHVGNVYLFQIMIFWFILDRLFIIYHLFDINLSLFLSLSCHPQPGYHPPMLVIFIYLK